MKKQNWRQAVLDRWTRYIIFESKPNVSPIPVTSVRGKRRAMELRGELEHALKDREKSWGFGYYLVRQ